MHAGVREHGSIKMRQVIIRTILTSILTTLIAGTVLAQQIQGDVRYAESGQPTLGALVRCDGTGGYSSQITDRNGKFFFRVSPGHYTVTAEAPGFIEAQKSVDLLDRGQSEYIPLRLQPAKSEPAVHPRQPVLDARVPVAAQKEFEKAEAALASRKKERLRDGVDHLQK